MQQFEQGALKPSTVTFFRADTIRILRPQTKTRWGGLFVCLLIYSFLSSVGGGPAVTIVWFDTDDVQNMNIPKTEAKLKHVEMLNVSSSLIMFAALPSDFGWCTSDRNSHKGILKYGAPYLVYRFALYPL